MHSSRGLALASVVVFGSVTGVAGCAARFQGELDGEPIPTFSTAAFVVEDRDAPAAAGVAGIALPGDSCAEATTFIGLQVDDAEATSAERRRETRAALAAWHARVLPRGAWTLQVQVETPGRNLLSDLSVDLDDADTDADVTLTLCQSDDDADPDDTNFVADLDCSLASDGVVELALDEAAGTFGLSAGEPLTFVDTANNVDGRLRLEADFTACPGLAEPLAALRALGGAPSPQPGPTPEPGPIDGGGSCQQRCFVDETGARVCESICSE